MKATLVTGPAFLASALINGDTSGLEQGADMACLQRFLNHVSPGSVIDVARDENEDMIEPRFTWNFNLHCGDTRGGNVLDYVVLYPENFSSNPIKAS